ncbi:MAG: hypothetical protein ACRDZO_02420 [Egibacteraceae bacterium]
MVEQATIDHAGEVLRPFSLIGTGDLLITDFPLEDLTALQDVEFEWACGVGIDTSRLGDVVAATTTQSCINTLTGFPPGSDSQLDCATANDDDPGPPMPA